MDGISFGYELCESRFIKIEHGNFPETFFKAFSWFPDKDC